jgi:hypothetical protein
LVLERRLYRYGHCGGSQSLKSARFRRGTFYGDGAQPLVPVSSVQAFPASPMRRNEAEFSAHLDTSQLFFCSSASPPSRRQEACSSRAQWAVTVITDMMNRTDARIAGNARAFRAAGVENHLGARTAAASGCGFQPQRLNPIRREALSRLTRQPAWRPG